MARRRQPLPALLASLVLAWAGCGGSDKSSFKDDYKSLNDQLIKAGQTLGRAVSGVPGKSNRQIAASFSGAAAQLEAVNRKLKQLDPPDDLKDETQALTRGVDDVIQTSRQIGAAARAGDPKAAGAASAKLPGEARRVNSAQNVLAKATGAKRGAS